MNPGGAFTTPEGLGRTSPKSTLSALGAAVASLILSLGAASDAQINVTADQYLAGQPKPNFATNSHLPHLTRWGGTLDSNTTVELANHWGYTLTLSEYATPQEVATITVPGTFDYGMAQLVKSNPGKYKLSILLDRTFYPPIPNDLWSTNSAGLFIDYYSNTWASNIYTNGQWHCSTNTNSGDWLSYSPWVSPQSSAATWQAITLSWMTNLLYLQSLVPITTILNGGEYGLQSWGWAGNVWQNDARVQSQSVVTNPWTRSYTNGVSWARYVSQAKAFEHGFLTAAIKQNFPNRELYIFYNTDNEQYRDYRSTDLYWMDEFDQWGWWSRVMNTNTDVPSFEAYYGSDGVWTNNGTQDMLTLQLNAVGYDINLGYKTNYSWVCGGWGVNYQPDANYPDNFAAIPTYMGFLKCLYTAGMNGGIAGYFSYPVGGFGASFPSNSPPNWLQQMIALSHVHALFSQLESFTDNSDLISGPQPHAMSIDQPAYEFANTAADATARVLARKLRSGNQWLIAAWAAAGPNRNVTVNIPVLGPVTLLARDSGAVYEVVSNTSNMRLIDTNGMLPSASFSPVPAPPSNLHVIPVGPPVTLITNFIVSGGTWTVPSDWNNSNNLVMCIGGGGAGYSGGVSTLAGGGGAGGDYAQIANVSLTPNATVNIGVGAGASTEGAAGGDTWFNGTSMANASCGAKGGAGALGTSGGGASGNTANDVGTVTYAGGAGGDGLSNTGGGGGGGAAGPSGPGGAGGADTVELHSGGGGGGNGGGSNGASPSNANGAAGGNNAAGTGGGSGGTSSANATPGTSGGGGGGGSGDTVSYSAGANGSPGIEWTSRGSGGGGGGGGASGSAACGNGGLYGGGGAGSQAGANSSSFGAGAPGIIVIIYGHY